jgi:hypothetical protein
VLGIGTAILTPIVSRLTNLSNTVCTMVPETKTKSIEYTTCRMVPEAKQKTIEYQEVRYVPIDDANLDSK